jgi:hypothetical protein
VKYESYVYTIDYTHGYTKHHESVPESMYSYYRGNSPTVDSFIQKQKVQHCGASQIIDSLQSTRKSSRPRDRRTHIWSGTSPVKSLSCTKNSSAYNSTSEIVNERDTQKTKQATTLRGRFIYVPKRERYPSCEGIVPTSSLRER